MARALARSFWALCAVALVTAAVLWSSSASASAASQFHYAPTLSAKLSEELEKGGSTFAEPWGMSFDSAGNLYVADPLEGTDKEGIIDKFSAEEKLDALLGEEALGGQSVRAVSVNDETGHIYANDGSSALELFVLGSDGELLSRWMGASTPSKTFGVNCCFLYDAVDNSSGTRKGYVYLATRHKGGAEQGEVDVFKPKNGDLEEGEFVESLKVSGGFNFTNGDQGIAVSQTSGEVYVADPGNKAIDRFSANGSFEGQIKGPSPTPSEPERSLAEPIAVAVDPTSGDVFVIDHQKGIVIGGAEVVDEFSATGEFIAQIKETGTNEPFHEPKGLAIEGTGPNAGDLYVSDAGAKKIDVFATEAPPPGPPSIEKTGVQQLSEESATFLGEVNPHGAATEFRFEYGRCASPSSCISTYEHSTPEEVLGATDFKTHAVGPVQVEGLSPNTTYHMHLVAHNANGPASGEERIFRTPPTPAERTPVKPPDGRAWELVSPADKRAGVPYGGGGVVSVIQAAAKGGAITYPALAPVTGEPEGVTGELQVLSRRTASGWESRDLALPHGIATGAKSGTVSEYRFFAEDLSAAVVQPFGRFDPAVSAEASEQTPYLSVLAGCSSACEHPLVTARPAFENVPAGTSFGEEGPCEAEGGGARVECGPRAQAVTPDLSHIVLRSAAPLVSQPPHVPRNELYEWANGHLALVSVLAPNGKGEELPAPTGAGVNEFPLLGAGFGVSQASARRAISNDGMRVFWESGSTLYMRDMAKEQTLQIDAPEPGCPESECKGGKGRFQIANTDATRVFFTDERHLTKDAGAGPKEPDLYECKIVEAAGRLRCDLTDLTPIESGKGADVQGDVLGASEDGKTVYLVADGTLGSGATRGTCVNNGETGPQAAGASCNVYVDKEGTIRLGAVLGGLDRTDWEQHPERQPTRVSPNGQWLTFMSASPLTGYDNTDAVSDKPDAEVYLYDASTEDLVCASCNPSGARPRGIEYGKLEEAESEALLVGSGEWEREGWVAGLVPHGSAISNDGEPARQSRALLDNGRLFFNELDPLVPQDENTTGDVYEYEPSGVGSCSGEGAPGCVALISSGKSPAVSSFFDASESGDDVFFLTSEQLTKQDVDTAPDVYDAHVCTIISPCFEPPPPPPNSCREDPKESTCRPAVSPQPGVFGPFQSQTFSGPGNVSQLSRAATPKAKPKPPTRAQLLAKALTQCRKRYAHSKKRRSACERTARKKYGPKKKAKSKKSKKKGKR